MHTTLPAMLYTKEAFAMGIHDQRNLPDPHPIFNLFVPHTHYIMAINSLTRATCINEGGTIDKTLGIVWSWKSKAVQIS